MTFSDGWHGSDDNTVVAYDDVEWLVGSHSPGSANALGFLQMNDGLSAAEGQVVQQTVPDTAGQLGWRVA